MYVTDICIVCFPLLYRLISLKMSSVGGFLLLVFSKKKNYVTDMKRGSALLVIA